MPGSILASVRRPRPRRGRPATGAAEWLLGLGTVLAVASALCWAVPSAPAWTVPRSMPAPREFQREARDFFDRNAARAASEGRPLRLQLPDGVGKTFTIGAIIARDLQKNPAGRHVVFVASPALAARTVAGLVAFGLDARVVEKEGWAPEAGRVLVCTPDRTYRLPQVTFRIKIVKYAHLLTEAEAEVLRTVRATLAADFAVEFPAPLKADFSYAFEAAVEQGYVSDLRVHYAVLEGSSESFSGAMLDLVVQNRDRWAPMLVTFGEKANAEEGAAKLRQSGVDAVFLETTEELENGTEPVSEETFEAVCVAHRIAGFIMRRKFADALRTVVVAQPPIVHNMWTSVERIASRMCMPHPSKCLAKASVAVLPLDVSLGEPKGLYWPQQQKGEAEEGEAEAEGPRLKGWLVCDRSGKVISGNRHIFFEHWYQILRRVVSERGSLPPMIKSQNATISGLCLWVSRLRTSYVKGELASEQVERLAQVPAMRERMQSWDRIKTTPEEQLDDMISPEEGVEIDHAEIQDVDSWEYRFDQLRRWLLKGQGPPSTVLPRGRRDGLQLARWLAALRQQYQSQQMPEERRAKLAAVPELESTLARWEQGIVMTGRSSWSEMAEQVRAHVLKKGRLPERDDKNPPERENAKHLRALHRQYLLSPQDLDVAQLLDVEGVAERWREEAVVLPREQWRRQLQELGQWLETQDMVIPSNMTAADREERRFASLVANARALAKYGLAPEDELESVPGLLDFIRQDRRMPVRIV